MKFQFLRDLYQLAIGKQPVPTERLLGPMFALIVLVTITAIFAVLSSLRPMPIVRPAPKILPVTVEAPAPALAPAELSAPRIVQVTIPAAQSTVPAIPVDDVVTYRVKDGDTFGALARQYCFDYVAVARENNIADPNWIYANKTVLKFKNGCAHAPSVLVKQNVSPRELVSNGGASSGKRTSSVVASRDTEAPKLPPVAASAPALSASQPTQAAAPVLATDANQPLSETRHREIYRVAALKRIKPEERTRAENAELHRLQMNIRKEVLARYKLPNPDCLYANTHTIGRNWEEQTLAQVRCIRENYGTVIDEVAAEYRLEPAFIEAVIMTESEGRPDAISPTGCTGVKQFTRRSARLFGLPDRFDPFEGIRAGGRHLQDNLNLWRGNIAKATAHFNVGSVEVGSAGFNAAQFPYTQNVLRVKRLIEKESRRIAAGQPSLVPVSYVPAR